MAGKKPSSSSHVSIGNCKVDISGKSYGCEPSDNSLLITVSGDAEIKISVDARKRYPSRKSNSDLLLHLDPRNGDEGRLPLEDHCFLLVNPKDEDSHSKALLQEVLKIYMTELPAMIYAANTGKESLFLQRCTSSGKYKTLILRSNSIKGLEEVIAAISYQVVPVDTQCAEIPLAAVSSKYQKKGIGQLLYMELKKRLHSVGISKIFCWADKESVGFWCKQGFISIGEVDCKGKARKLPIKAGIRRALCFPGYSTLMVSHLKDNTPFSSSQPVRMDSFLKERVYGSLKSSIAEESKNKHVSHHIEATQSQIPTRDQLSTDLQNFEDTQYISGQGVKRRVWEASLSSLKSKRVKGGHVINGCEDSSQDLAFNDVGGIDATFDDCSLGKSVQKATSDQLLRNPILCFGSSGAKGNISGSFRDVNVSKGVCPRIMIMNIADVEKKTWLTNIVQELGGSVTCDGGASTHVITGKARKTLNFCMALCSGAWIVSPSWLKSSFKEGKFLGESQFILEDEDYELKYKSKLKDAVLRARPKPHSLLNGFDVCIAKHVQPSLDVLCTLIKSAGGNVNNKLGSVKEPARTIFLACEEDMEDALAAAKKRLWTFSVDWFMSCIMKQELDLGAPQFTVSL